MHRLSQWQNRRGSRNDIDNLLSKGHLPYFEKSAVDMSPPSTAREAPTAVWGENYCGGLSSVLLVPEQVWVPDMRDMLKVSR